jgi:hypothetical protein
MRLPIQSFTAIVVISSAMLGPDVASAAPRAAATCSDLDMVVATFVSRGASVYMIPPERLPLVAQDAEALTGAHYVGVTRGFLVKGKVGFVLGFEIGGCLLDPITIKAPPISTAEVGSA